MNDTKNLSDALRDHARSVSAALREGGAPDLAVDAFDTVADRVRTADDPYASLQFALAINALVNDDNVFPEYIDAADRRTSELLGVPMAVKTVVDKVFSV